MFTNSRKGRLVYITVSPGVSAKGHYIGKDKQGLILIDVNGRTLKGKPVCNDQVRAAA